MVAATESTANHGLSELFTDQTKSFVYGLQPVSIIDEGRRSTFANMKSESCTRYA